MPYRWPRSPELKLYIFPFPSGLECTLTWGTRACGNRVLIYRQGVEDFNRSRAKKKTGYHVLIPESTISLNSMPLL